MKIMKKLAFASLLMTSVSVNAGVYTDDLSRCLVESSTSDDKIALVKWMYTSMSLHPAVADISAVKEKHRDTANKDMAELMVDLISVRCLDQSKKAIKYEGEVALQASFSVLGQVAGQELFADPNVAEGLNGLEKHIDIDLLNSRIEN